MKALLKQFIITSIILTLFYSSSSQAGYVQDKLDSVVDWAKKKIGAVPRDFPAHCDQPDYFNAYECSQYLNQYSATTETAKMMNGYETYNVLRKKGITHKQLCELYYLSREILESSKLSELQCMDSQ